MSGSTLRLRISSESDATRSLIAASRFAEEIGFSRADCQSIATAVSELARNILKYAGDGEILIVVSDDAGRVDVRRLHGDNVVSGVLAGKGAGSLVLSGAGGL